MSKRIITIDPLSIDSVEAAIKIIDDMKASIEKKVTEFINELVGMGVNVAKMELSVMNAIDTGELVNSIDGKMLDNVGGVYNDNVKAGVIFTKTWYAPFVEYGTGVVGAGNAYPGERMPSAVVVGDKSYSSYDQNHHGEGGWFYIAKHRDGKLHWTAGQPSSPFMYNTYLILRQQAPGIAARIFGSL